MASAPQLIYACIDDTDMPGTRGTNRLAIAIAKELRGRWRCRSITKHPHLRHPDIPYTHGNNSCCMIFEAAAQDEQPLRDFIRQAMLDDFIEGSDPGICVTARVPRPLQPFAERSRREVLGMDEAYALAAAEGLILEGLGGTNQGVIGALAGLGSAAAGQPGQFLWLEDRELDFGGLLQPAELEVLGITHFFDADSGDPLPPRSLWVPKKLRPSMRGGRPVLFVQPSEHASYELVRRD
jgi:hypothetical protein